MSTPKPYPEVDSASAALPDKVAETVAAPYLMRTELERGISSRQSAPRFIAGLPASDEVWKLAKEKELVPHLEIAVHLAHDHFKEIREIKLTYLPDPELPQWETIAVNLYVGGTMDELLQADQKYTRAFTTMIPYEKQFHICMQVMPEKSS